MNVEIGSVAAQFLFLGICVSNFLYWFFAVWVQDTLKNSVLQDIKQYSFPIGQDSQRNKCYTLQRKSHLCIPFLGIVWPQSQFPHYVSVSASYTVFP
jgi:hypothetical protein